MANGWTRIGDIATASRPGGGVGAAVSIQIDIEALRQRLAAVGRILNPREMMEAIGFRWLRWVNENLREAGVDQQWPPMSPNTILVRPTRMSDRHFSSRYLSRLSQSFVANVTDTTVEVGTEQEYADYHHFGTRPYDIYPRTAKFLKFRTTGGWRFAKVVHHPGLPARALLPTKDVAERITQELLNAYAERAEAEFNDEASHGNFTE
jgi:phage gpG-like protein